MAEKKAKKRRPGPAARSAPVRPAVVEPARTVEDERAAFEAAQRAAVRRTTSKIVLFCILVGLATAAVMLAGGGSGP